MVLSGKYVTCSVDLLVLANKISYSNAACVGKHADKPNRLRTVSWYLRNALILTPGDQYDVKTHPGISEHMQVLRCIKYSRQNLVHFWKVYIVTKQYCSSLFQQCCRTMMK